MVSTTPMHIGKGSLLAAKMIQLKARAAFAAARTEVQKIVDQQPDFAAALSLLGMIDAGLDKKEEALKEGQRACELLPISKDAIDGTTLGH